MAKISTYPLDGTPNLGDKLIGTDIDNLNATKNYTIGQILSVAGSSTYVPYTGATGNVDLGNNDLEGDNLTANLALYTNQLYQLGVGNIATYDNSSNQLGWIVNFSQQKVRIGDFNGISTGTELIVDYNNQWVEIVNGALRLNGSVGAAGDVLRSQGAGLSPQWVAASSLIPNIQQVLTAGSTTTNQELTIVKPGTGGLILGYTGTGEPRLFIASTTIGPFAYTSEVNAAGITIRDTSQGLYGTYNPYSIEYEDNNANQNLTLYANPANFNTNTIEYPSGTGTFAISVNGIGASSTGDVVNTIDNVLAAGNTATDKELIINSTGAVTGTIKLDGITGPGATPNIFLSSDNGLVQNETEIRPAVILLENVTTQKRAEYNQEAIVFSDLNSGLYTTLQALTANLSANDVFLPSGGGTLALSVNGIPAGSGGDVPLPATYSNSVLPTYLDYAVALAALGGNPPGFTYLYHDQTTNSIGAVRL